MSRWFRFYDEALDDPKVQMLRPELFKAWVNLLCLASRNGGVLPTEEEITFALRLSEEKACAFVAELCAKGLLDRVEARLQPHNWDRRQYKSDFSNERVKRHRERERNADVTAGVTPPETEADTETETDSSGGYSRAQAAAASNSVNLEELAQQCEKASGLALGGRRIDAIAGMMAEGISLDDRILPVLRDATAELRAWNKPLPKTWAYFEKPIRDASRKAKPPDKPVELIFVAEGSDLWQQIEKRSGFYRDWLKGNRQVVNGIAGTNVPPNMMPMGAA